MQGWHVQSLDLRGRRGQLESLDPQGAIFLGCTFDGGAEDSLRGRGALIFPRLEAVPFNPYRSQLYTPQERMQGSPRHATRTRSTRGCTSGASGRASATASRRPWPRPCTTTRSATPWTN